MAENVYLELKADGTQIEGDSTVASMDRANKIECSYFSFAVDSAREPSTGMATGRRTYEPIVFRKRIDGASPLIAKALCDNQDIEATFRFYRPALTGDGTTEQYYTVTIQQARIAKIGQVSPDSTNPATSTDPEQEEVACTFGVITWTIEESGVSHDDSWSEQT